MDEAGEPGQRTEANAGEPDVHMELNVGVEVAEEGTVPANVEEVEEVPSGDDALALLEARGIRLENVELEGGLGDQPTPEEIFETLVVDELSATSTEDKLRVRLKRLGANPDMISHPFTTKALEDLASVEAFFASVENAKSLENRISVSRRIHPKSEVALNHYFLEIFHALTCGKIALNVAFALMETLLGAFAFLSRKVRDRRVERTNEATIKNWRRYLAQRETATLLMEYKAIMETESQRQRDCHTRRMSLNAEPPEQRANSRRYILQTSYLATLDFRERRYICAVLIFFFLLNNFFF